MNKYLITVARRLGADDYVAIWGFEVHALTHDSACGLARRLLNMGYGERNYLVSAEIKGRVPS